MLNMEPSEVWNLVHNCGIPVQTLARRHSVGAPEIFEALALHAPVARELDWQSITGRPTRLSADRLANRPGNWRGGNKRYFDHAEAAAAVASGESCRSVGERLGVSATRINQVARKAMVLIPAA